METAIEKKNQTQTIRELLEKNKSQIQMALPKHMTADKMLRVSMTCLQKNPKLLDCHPATLVGAFIQCAQWGFEPGLGNQVHLIPFWNSSKNRFEVQVMPGYSGLADLAVRSGEVKRIMPRAVYEKDKFFYSYGIDQKLEHEPSPDGNRGELTHVYAIAIMSDGSKEFAVLTKTDIEEARNRSKAKDSGPWKTDFVAMALKTAIRRICKFLPSSTEKSSELQRAVLLDERAEIGLPQDLGLLADVEETATETESSEQIQSPKRESEKEITPTESKTVENPAELNLDKPKKEGLISIHDGVKEVKSKNGVAKNGKPYVRHTIIGMDGTYYNTFDEKLAALAQTVKNDGFKVDFVFTTSNFGNNLEDIKLDGF